MRRARSRAAAVSWITTTISLTGSTGAWTEYSPCPRQLLISVQLVRPAGNSNNKQTARLTPLGHLLSAGAADRLAVARAASLLANKFVDQSARADATAIKRCLLTTSPSSCSSLLLLISGLSRRPSVVVAARSVRSIEAAANR